MIMKTHTFLTRVLPIVLGGAILVPSMAYAVAIPVGGAAHVNAAATTQVVPPGAASTSVSAAASVKVDTKLQLAIDKADKEIDRRITALQDLNARIDATERVTAEFKQKLSTNVSNHLAGLTQLKAKIDADTDAATLKVDVKTITDSYRVFMLVVPQARIAAAADREITIITMMNQLGAKLQTRLSSAQSAGVNVAALLTALTDMSAKLNDASTQAQAAVTGSSALVPDEGDKTKMAQNATALKMARADISVSRKDLIIAQKDAETVVKGLKLLASASATTTAAASTTTH